MGAMSAVPPERLVRLLNLLEKNIRDGAKISLLGNQVNFYESTGHRNIFLYVPNACSYIFHCLLRFHLT